RARAAARLAPAAPRAPRARARLRAQRLGQAQPLDHIIEYFRTLGIPAPELQAPFAAAMELLCGLAVLLGLCTRLAAVPLIVIMIVAIRTAQTGAFAEASGVLDW